jgi:hypothetical protein
MDVLLEFYKWMNGFNEWNWEILDVTILFISLMLKKGAWFGYEESTLNPIAKRSQWKCPQKKYLNTLSSSAIIKLFLKN